MSFSLNFTHAYGVPAGAGGIRHRLEDFRVIEVSEAVPQGSGEHVYLSVRKSGANTAWVAAKIAEFAGIAENDVGFAGRKDRHAITDQWFSCYLPDTKDGANNLDWSAFEAEGVEVLEVKRHGRKLRKGDLKGNRFELTIRNLQNRPDIEARLIRVRDSGVPNYFGEQRFGRDLGNLEHAHQILTSQNSGKRNRDIYLSAARSYMFNHFLSNRISTGGWDDISGMEEGPLYGMSRDPRPGEKQMPLECTGWCDGLQSLRVKSGSRNLKLKPKELQFRFSSDDEGEKLQLTFFLTSGAFATSLLREVLTLTGPKA